LCVARNSWSFGRPVAPFDSMMCSRRAVGPRPVARHRLDACDELTVVVRHLEAVRPRELHRVVQAPEYAFEVAGHR
jgi:hypothetical protein